MEGFPAPDQDPLDLFSDEPGSSWDELIMAGWDPSDHGDPETDPDDDEAWWASLPPDIRAELEARPPVTAAPWESPAAARTAFADRGVGDEMLPGWHLGQVLAEATLDGYGELTDDELSGVLRARQRQIARDYAELARTVTEVAERRAERSRRPGWSGLFEHVTDELAVELTLTGRSAGRLLDVATGLRRLPEVSRELLNGAIDWARAGVFVDELSALDDKAAQAIAECLADRAAGWTTGQLRAALVRAVLAADPDAAERRKTAARKETRVETWREPSGNAVLAGRELPTGDAMAADAQLTADADWLRSNGAAGTLAELRAMAYLARLSGRELTALIPQTSPGAADGSPEGTGSGEGVCKGAGPDGSVGSCVGSSGGSGSSRGGSGASRTGEPSRAGSVHVTMPLSTLAGLSDSPGEVAGYGPVDATTSRELAGLLSRDPATQWCLTVTGPDGVALAHACARGGPATAAPGQLAEPGQLVEPGQLAEPGQPRERGEPVIRWAAGLLERLLVLESGTCGHAREAAGYVPPPRLRHLVTVRQQRCSFPGCRRPARRCDLDHTVPFEAGGLTCECNLAPLCRTHHRAKQVPGWRLTQAQPGVMTWRLPSGREYHTVGATYPV